MQLNQIDLNDTDGWPLAVAENWNDWDYHWCNEFEGGLETRAGFERWPGSWNLQAMLWSDRS